MLPLELKLSARLRSQDRLRSLDKKLLAKLPLKLKLPARLRSLDKKLCCQGCR